MHTHPPAYTHMSTHHNFGGMQRAPSEVLCAWESGDPSADGSEGETSGVAEAERCQGAGR
eukprot:55430-Eustigmatos_ZCMA.PRE.1